MSSLSPAFYFLGVRFWNSDTDRLLKVIDSTGGMLTVPSAPSLAQMGEDPLLRKCYQNSEWAVMDGGYVAMIIRALGRNCRRISGLQLVQKVTAPPGAGPVPMRRRRILWVAPSAVEENRIRRFLESQGFDAELQFFYNAPFYKTDAEFEDAALTALCAEVKPDWIVVCLGGGRQEKLGDYLNRNLHTQSRRPAILCTGAAIAFLTGGQANIPTWADRLYLGWFLRILRSPGTFFPRYARAAWHFPLALWRFRGAWFTPPQAVTDPGVEAR